MVVIGMGLVWAGYTVGIWGYCLLSTYNVPFRSLFKADWPKPQNVDVQQSSPAASAGGAGTPSAPKVRQIPPVQAF